MAGERFPPSSRPAPGDAEVWDEAAKTVILSMLDSHYAMTASEMEARSSDRVWNAMVWPWVINPHHLTNARNALAAAGGIESTSAPTRSHPDPIITWSRPPTHGIQRLILDTAARKRLLTARHAGWGKRGGAGRGLIGRADIDAILHDATLHSNLDAITLYLSWRR